MKSRKHIPVTSIGITSLLMVFIVVSMAIFSLLSLSDAMRDYNFSKMLANHNSDYYAASNIAQEQIAIIDQSIGHGGFSEADKIDGVSRMSIDGKNVFFTVQIDDSKELAVMTNSSGGHVKVTMYSSVQTKEWNGDLSLHLMK